MATTPEAGELSATSPMPADEPMPEWERQLLTPPLLYDGGTVFRDLPPVEVAISRHNLSLLHGVLTESLATLQRMEDQFSGTPAASAIRSRSTELSLLRSALINL